MQSQGQPQGQQDIEGIQRIEMPGDRLFRLLNDLDQLAAKYPGPEANVITNFTEGMRLDPVGTMNRLEQQSQESTNG